MLDPDEIEAVKNKPGLPYGPRAFTLKTGDPTGDPPTAMESPSFSITNSIDNAAGDQDSEGYDFESDAKTDAEVSRFSFFDRLEHYMEHMQICMENLKAVELTLMVEAGSSVRKNLRTSEVQIPHKVRQERNAAPLAKI
jgi:hypothetical protein